MANQEQRREAKDMAVPPPVDIDARDVKYIICNLPHGLYLSMCKWKPDSRGGHQDGKKGDENRGFYEHDEEFGHIRIRGANAPDAVNGWGITQIPEKSWNAWYAANLHNRVVKGHFIDAFNHKADAVAEAHRRGFVSTGTEPINPDKPGRIGEVDFTGKIQKLEKREETV